jgi:sugar phosphate isomerase/epimerase
MPPNPWRELTLLQQTIDFGLNTLQLGDNLAVHGLSKERLETLKRQAHTNRIRLEVGARKLTRENLRAYLELSAYLNAPLLRFVIDDDHYTPPPEEIKRIIKEFVPELENSKIKLGIENHDRFKAKELAAMIEEIGSSQVGVCLDCVNSMGAGEGLEFVAGVLAPYTINLHIKDFTVQRLPHKMGFTVTGTEAGKGMTNLPLLLDLLSPYDRCTSAVLEQWTPPETSIQETVIKENNWARSGIQYLKTFKEFNSHISH